MDFVCHNQRVGSPKTSPFQVTVAYVESRLFMAEASADPNATNDWDDPLEDEALLRAKGGAYHLV